MNIAIYLISSIFLIIECNAVNSSETVLNLNVVKMRQDTVIGVLIFFGRDCIKFTDKNVPRELAFAIDTNDSTLFPSIAKDISQLQDEIKCAVRSHKLTDIFSVSNSTAAAVDVIILILIKYLAMKNSLIFIDGYTDFKTTDKSKAWYSMYLALYLASFGTGGQPVSALFEVFRVCFRNYENIVTEITELRRYMINYEQFVINNVISKYSLSNMNSNDKKLESMKETEDIIEKYFTEKLIYKSIISDPQEQITFNTELQNSVREIVKSSETQVEFSNILPWKNSKKVKTGLLSFLKDIEIRKIKYHFDSKIAENYIEKITDWGTITFKLNIFKTKDGMKNFIFIREPYIS